MSSIVRWGGIAGVVAAVLLVLSAILNQLSPVQTTYDSAASYLYLAVIVAAYVQCWLRCSVFTQCTAEDGGTGVWALSGRR